MHLRRFVLGAITTLPMLGYAGFAAAQVSPGDAKAFITTSGQQLVAVVNSNASTADKAQQLQTLVNNMVAVDQVGDYVLGRYKTVATPCSISFWPTTSLFRSRPIRASASS
jgi:phospholipid transport system substrate-binding protein